MKKKYHKWAVEGESVHDGWNGRIKGAVFRFDDIYQADRWVLQSPETRRVTFSSNPIVKKARETGSFQLPDSGEIAAPAKTRFVRPVCDCPEAFEALMATHDVDIQGVPEFKFCPWCATPFQAPAETSPPRAR